MTILSSQANTAHFGEHNNLLVRTHYPEDDQFFPVVVYVIEAM